MATNPFKAALREGRAQIGLWQALASPYTAEICAAAGFDWLMFDGEHAPNDVRNLLSQLQAVSGHATHAVARPPIGEAWILKQYLDIGFSTLLVPLVESAAQARQLVDALRYPPQGGRGVATGIVRASGWGRDRDYAQRANDEVCLLLQVETRAGLEQIDAITATDGVDGIFIGPADLCASLGFRGQPDHPEVQAAIGHAIDRVRALGKAPGILMADPVKAQRYLDLGCLFVAVGTDVSLLVGATSALAARFKPAHAAPGAAPGAVY